MIYRYDYAGIPKQSWSMREYTHFTCITVLMSVTAFMYSADEK